MRCLLCTRYGKVMLMTDQDHDGSHIKGLFFNMIHHFWPELLQRNDFICEFVTPIVKCFPAQREGAAARALEKSFFTLQEFSRWYQGLSDGEKRKCFCAFCMYLYVSSKTGRLLPIANLARHKLDMHYSNDQDDNALQLAFSSDSHRRKAWLLAHVARGGTARDFSAPSLLTSK